MAPPGSVEAHAHLVEPAPINARRPPPSSKQPCAWRIGEELGSELLPRPERRLSEQAFSGFSISSLSK
jgi:hypothetical protein